MASPPCTTFSSLQRVTKIDMPTSTREEGLMLLKVAVKVCMLKVNSSNVFIFEYPVGASSWKEECVIELVNMSGVQKFRAGPVHERPRERLRRKSTDEEDNEDPDERHRSGNNLEHDVRPSTS